MTTPKFSPGDRVKVYGGFKCQSGPGNWSGGTHASKGTVVQVLADDCIIFKYDEDYCEYSAHPKQVRKIKPKPQAEVKKAREFEISLSETGYIGIIKFCDIKHGERIRVREMLPNSITLTRESLVKGLHEAGILFFSAQRIDKLCKALGFEDSK